MKFALIAALAVMALIVLQVPVLAQCAMCKAAVTGATNAAALAKSLNLAGLVLLIPPVTIFSAIFIVAYKHRRAPRETVFETPEDDWSRRE